MSKKEIRDAGIWDTKMRVFGRDGWQCVYVDDDGIRCPRQATQLAHVLPQDKLHIARFGLTVIHHPMNLRGTCPQHNASVQVNYRSQPREAERIASEIEKVVSYQEGGETSSTPRFNALTQDYKE